MHDTQVKRYRTLNFEYFLDVRVPCGKLSDGLVCLVEPPSAGRPSGFALHFEALVLILFREMLLAAVARLVGESWHRVAAIAEHYAERALEQVDLVDVHELAIDETSRARGHEYFTLAADPQAPRRRDDG